jgi:hypothetical protein
MEEVRTFEYHVEKPNIHFLTKYYIHGSKNAMDNFYKHLEKDDAMAIKRQIKRGSIKLIPK